MNDKYGHDAGDAVLRAVPGIISKVLRTQDICSRWGGEEFLILLPETPITGVIHVAERLRKTFEQNRVQYGNQPISITISAGAQEYRASKNLEDCLKQADKNLYQAKASGRNTVVAGNSE